MFSNKKSISRREMLRLSGTGLAGTVLAACTQPTEAPTEAPAEAPTEAPAEAVADTAEVVATEADVPIAVPLGEFPIVSTPTTLKVLLNPAGVMSGGMIIYSRSG